MGLAGTPDRDIANVVGLAPPALAARKAAIVSGALGDQSPGIHSVRSS